MREIKIRAWHKQQKLWFPVIAISWMDGWIEVEPSPDSSWRTRLEDFKLMQYTGVKDSAGVEIFEGDIIQTTYKAEEIGEDSDVVNITTVAWNPASAGFDRREGDMWCDLGMERDETLSELVIGNIFEHPELLEAE